VSRKEAGKLLLVDENPRGTFLVRPSEHNPRGYSLSVKDWEEGRGHHVKHYKIKPLDNGGFFIATNQTFPTLPALVMAYSSELQCARAPLAELGELDFHGVDHCPGRSRLARRCRR
jgi:hypothetical protein